MPRCLSHGDSTAGRQYDQFWWRAATLLLGLIGTVPACDRGFGRAESATHEDHGDVYVQGQPEEVTPEAIEAARLDASWRQVVRLDTATLRDSAGSAEQWEQIAVESVNGSAMHVPLYGDVAGPFVDLPPLKGDAIYEVAKKPCTCYESLGEKLSELFHATPEVLAKSDPETSLDSLEAGDPIWVPNVRDAAGTPIGTVAQIVVSDRGRHLHAVDSAQRILYHFPTTVGASYDPSPSGNYKVTAIRENPIWHFQPDLLAKVPDYKADARIPAGPNNAVGVVWMALSAPHYGIHGTNPPETIGYTSSAGCVRLTNWDALFLSKRIQPGVRVLFRDTRSA